MVKTTKFVIEGNNFNDLESFYDEFERVFLSDFPKTFKFGRNLNAYDDILYKDPKDKSHWVITWNNFDRSKKELPSKILFGELVRILKRHKEHTVVFKTNSSKIKNKTEKLGVIGFYLAIIPLILSMILLPLIKIESSFLIWALFFIIISLPMISLFLCMIQLNRKVTKLAIAGLIISFFMMFRNWIALKVQF